MCSFIFFNFHPDNIEYINEINQKRGPDFTNITTKNNYFMLHNLLSITGDFAKQPFKIKDSPLGISTGALKYPFEKVAIIIYY